MRRFHVRSLLHVFRCCFSDAECWWTRIAIGKAEVLFTNPVCIPGTNTDPSFTRVLSSISLAHTAPVPYVTLLLRYQWFITSARVAQGSRGFCPIRIKTITEFWLWSSADLETEYNVWWSFLCRWGSWRGKIGYLSWCTSTEHWYGIYLVSLQFALLYP